MLSFYLSPHNSLKYANLNPNLILTLNSEPEMNMGHFFGPGSDPTHKRPTRDPTRLAIIVYNLARDPTRPDFMQMQCVTLQTIFLQ